MPQAAFKYPKVTRTPRDKKRPYKDVFIASGEDIGTTGWWYLYVKNPNNTDDPHLIWLTGQGIQYPRTSTADKILYPVIFTGAVAVDIVTVPLYIANVILLIPILLIVGI